MYWIGILILTIGWAVVWSQIPDGLFSLSGLIVLIGIILISVSYLVMGLDNEQ